MQRTCCFGSPDVPGLLLVEDRVHADRGLAGLAVTDDQLALAAADRGLRVDRLDAGLQRLRHRLALHHRRGLQLEHALLLGLDVAEAVDRQAQRVDHAAEELVADRHGQHAAGALDLLALLDVLVVTEDDRADLALVQVQRDAEDAAGELQQLVGHRRGQALDVRDAVTGLDDDRRPLRARSRSRSWRRSSRSRSGSRPRRSSAPPCSCRPCS